MVTLTVLQTKLQLGDTLLASRATPITRPAASPIQHHRSPPLHPLAVLNIFPLVQQLKRGSHWNYLNPKSLFHFKEFWCKDLLGSCFRCQDQAQVWKLIWRFEIKNCYSCIRLMKSDIGKCLIVYVSESVSQLYVRRYHDISVLFSTLLKVRKDRRCFIPNYCYWWKEGVVLLYSHITGINVRSSLCLK